MPSPYSSESDSAPPDLRPAIRDGIDAVSLNGARSLTATVFSLSARTS